MLSKLFARNARGGPSPTVQSLDESENIDGWSKWPSDVAQSLSAPPSAAPPSGGAARFHATVPLEILPIDSAAPPKPGVNEPVSRREAALATVDQHHPRVANTIRTMWGYKECSLYINKMIMSGGDGMGQHRVGFHADAVEAMLALADLHDAEFPLV